MRVKRLIVISFALIAACKSPAPAEQMDAIQSWMATAEMVGDAWLRHSVPDKYSRETLELSRATLIQLSGDLLESPPKPVDSAALDGVLTRSQERIGVMARLIKAKDAPEFSRQLDSLRADQKIVKRLARIIEDAQ